MDSMPLAMPTSSIMASMPCSVHAGMPGMPSGFARPAAIAAWR